MTAGGFRVDPGAVSGAAAELGSAADRLESVGTALTDALAAAGACWGGDESGQKFAEDYVPGAEGAVRAFTSLVEGLRGLQGNVVDAMTTYRTVDGTGASTVQRGS
ncbi:WXG100 family type VII secretion target [Umezawaea beigongshangensis]|uniref:WXG100 family type VII secretion target n=1 Tax=Umezawaea beigongshangensis TaxID=2780383 RepID=UPI0018F160D1|nr:WXG100 family type VII secretion target [Umezawaea beigongshangensis]